MALSTIGTAAIADDAITAAKIDDDGTGFTVGDLTVGNITSTGVTTGFVSPDSLVLDGSSVATVTVNSAVSSSATVVVDGVSGTIAVGMVVNVSDTTVRSITDAASQSAISVDDTLTITAVASQTSFTVSEAVSIADNVVLILRANESENFVLDASAASTDVGEKIQFEDATNDGSIAANNVAPTLLDVTGSLSNTVTIKSEGGATTTIIAQGLAKCWVDITTPTTGNGDPITLQDSHNVTSMTDNGTGQIMMLFVAPMSSVNYAILVGGGQSNNIATVDTGTQAAGQVRVETFNVSEALVNTDTMVVIHGDLA